MSVRCLKILLPILFAKSIFAQLPGIQRNNGCQSLPSPEISQSFNGQPTGNNLPAANNPFINNQPINANGLQTFSKMPYYNGQISELLNIASNINNRQLTGNNPSTLYQNLPVYNNNLQPGNNIPSNNPYLPINNPISNNLFNNIPNNVPVYNNAFNPNNIKYNLPENNNVLQNILQKSPKINSLTLTGPAFNNGLPFNVLPANVLDVPVNNFINHNDVPNSGLKIPRSLPANEITEASYANNKENNIWESYNSEMQTVQPLQNTMQANTGSPFNLAINTPTGNVPIGLQLNDGFSTNNLPLNKGEIANSFTASNFNTQPNNYQIFNNELQQYLNQNNGYQNNLPLANMPAGSVQPTGSVFNLPDMASINTLNLGEFGNLPMFNGLPVIGISETMTPFYSDQFNQNQIVV